MKSGMKPAMGLVQEQRWRAAPWEVWAFISLVGAQVGVVALMPGSTIRAGSGLLIYALIFGAFICGSWTARLLLIVMCAFELVGNVVLGSGGGWSVPPPGWLALMAVALIQLVILLRPAVRSPLSAKLD